MISVRFQGKPFNTIALPTQPKIVFKIIAEFRLRAGRNLIQWWVLDVESNCFQLPVAKDRKRVMRSSRKGPLVWSRVKGIELLSRLLWRDRQSCQEHMWAARLAVWDSTLELLVQDMHRSLTSERSEGLEEESLMRSNDFLEWKRRTGSQWEANLMSRQIRPCALQVGHRPSVAARVFEAGLPWPVGLIGGCWPGVTHGLPRALPALSDFLSARAAYPSFSFALERTQSPELFMTIKEGYHLLNVTL